VDSVLRAAIVYGFVLVLFRVAGKRSLAQMTTLDLVVLLIIAGATEHALLGDDFSLTNCFLLSMTLLGLDHLLSLWKLRRPTVSKLLEGLPLVLIQDGHVQYDRLAKARVDVNDILSEARTHQGLERLDQIKYAVLELNGTISIVPKAS